MAGKKSFPVLSRIRCSGTVYAPDTENDVIELDEKEAARLMSLGCIAEADDAEDGAVIDTEFDLKVALATLIADGHDVKSLNMADVGKLLGKNARGVKRDHVNEALVKIEKEAAV